MNKLNLKYILGATIAKFYGMPYENCPVLTYTQALELCNYMEYRDECPEELKELWESNTMGLYRACGENGYTCNFGDWSDRKESLMIYAFEHYLLPKYGIKELPWPEENFDGPEDDYGFLGGDDGYGRDRCSCGDVGCYVCDDNIRGFKLDR